MKLLLSLTLLFSFYASASEGEDIFVLKMQKAFDNGCILTVYTNTAKTAFAKVSFKSSTEYQNFSKNQIQNLKSDSIPKYGFDETFNAETKGHGFYTEEGNLYVKYSILNEDSGHFEEADNLLFENVDDCN